jgi:hypothetical protein
MKVIIAGSRGITDPELVERAIKESGFEITTVISGTARGVDVLGEQWAASNRIPLERYPADWDEDDYDAGFVRNSQMAKRADALVALWDGKSRGARSMIKKMCDLGKPVHVLYTEDL